MNQSLNLMAPRILQYCSRMDKNVQYSLSFYYFFSQRTITARIRTRVMETGQHTHTHTDGWPVLNVLFGWSLDGSMSVRLFLIRLAARRQLSGSQVRLSFNHLLLYYTSCPDLFKTSV